MLKFNEHNEVIQEEEYKAILVGIQLAKRMIVALATYREAQTQRIPPVCKTTDVALVGAHGHRAVSYHAAEQDAAVSFLFSHINQVVILGPSSYIYTLYEISK